MCENYYNNYCWQNHFYNEYMQQHAAMMKWIQNLHSNIDTKCVHNAIQTCQYKTHFPKAVHYDYNPREYNSANESSSTAIENCSSGSGSTTDSGIKEHDSLVTQEDDESDCEYEFNVDAIIAMREAKAELLKKETSSSSSSIVTIDNDSESFEFVELGSIQEMAAKQSIMVGGNNNRNENLRCEKEFKEHLYGEKSTTISGLETAMSLTYERLCDIHQPPIWPVYPLRLSSRA